MAGLNDKSLFRQKFQNRFGGTFADQVAVSSEAINKFKGVLPDELLEYIWQPYGFCSCGEGILWWVNPDDYHDLLYSYLADTPFAERRNLYVIARTAFGKLRVWEKNKGNTLNIYCLDNRILLNATEDRQDLDTEAEDFEMNRFIGTVWPSHCDEDDAQEKPLFSRALKKFGRLQADEMYGYKLSPVLGGKESITNLDKVKLFVYADIQRQMGDPHLIISDTENNTLVY